MRAVVQTDAKGEMAQQSENGQNEGDWQHRGFLNVF